MARQNQRQKKQGDILTPQYFGKYKAQVVDSYDEKEQRGRVRVKCPTVLGDDMSGWCEPCFTSTNDLSGDFSLPTVGETVWVEFEEGDPNKPIWIGNWHSENKTPLETIRGKENQPAASPLRDYKENHDKVRVISFDKCTLVMHKDYMRLYFGEAGDSEFYTNFDECYLSRTNGMMKFFSDNSTTSLVRADSVLIMTDGNTKLTKADSTITLTPNDISIKTQTVYVDAEVEVTKDITTKETIKAKEGEIGKPGEILIITKHKHLDVTPGSSPTGKPEAPT
jgi:phage baseplate assembly protein gpV